MARDRRQFEDDDGRTIVDMSGLDRPTIFGMRRPEESRRKEFEAPEERKPKRPWEESGWNRSERNAAIGGALASALLIAAAYIVGLGAIIAVIYFIAMR